MDKRNQFNGEKEEVDLSEIEREYAKILALREKAEERASELTTTLAQVLLHTRASATQPLSHSRGFQLSFFTCLEQ